MTRINDTAVFLHLYYLDLWSEVTTYLDNLEDFDLHITLPDSHKGHSLGHILERYPNTKHYFLENCGRDIRPFLFLLDVSREYRFYCKIHTKKSPHLDYGELWRRESYDALLGSPGRIKSNKELLSLADVALLAPRKYLIPYSKYKGDNETMLAKLLSNHKIELTQLNDFEYATGTMFWFNNRGRKILNQLIPYINNFEPESGAIDGTLAHAIERMIIPLLNAKESIICDEKFIDFVGIPLVDDPLIKQKLINYNQVRLAQSLADITDKEKNNSLSRMFKRLFSFRQ